MKKIAIVASLFPVLMILMLVLAVSSDGTSEVVPPLATEDKSIEYATIASEMGVPWQIVQLTDAVLANNQNQGDIENVNPFDTSTEFLIMQETKEEWIEDITSEDEGHNNQCPDDCEEEHLVDVDNSEWVFVSSELFTGKEAILNYCNITDTNGMNATKLREKASESAENKSNSMIYI